MLNYLEIISLFIILLYYAESNTFLQEMYKLFKVMHTDIKRLCNENQNLKKEICEIKSMASSSNLGGNKKRVLDYDSSWLMVCSKFFYCCLLSKFIFINVKYHFNF